MNEEKPGVSKRKQEVLLESSSETAGYLSEENRAVLSYFASEVARYIEAGVGPRLKDLEYRVSELDARLESPAKRRAVRGIMDLFSKYKLFRIIDVLRKHAADGAEFTKNSLLREAGVGQSFRGSGLDRLVDILLYNGLIAQSGKRGRGVLYSVTGDGKHFFQSYFPGRRELASEER